MISKHRLEFFSDAVIAIVITVMLLDLHPPMQAGWRVWLPKAPELLAYLMGFVMVAFSWVVHYQVFARTRVVSGGMLAANFCFLFLLSLMPLLVRGVAEHPHAPAPVLQLSICGYLQIQMMTIFRLSGRKFHWNDEGYQAWQRRRNRAGIVGIAQMAVVLLIAALWPIAADILIASFSVVAVFLWG